MAIVLSFLLHLYLGVELLSYLSNFELDYLLLAAESSYLIHVKVNNTKRKFLAPAHTQAASWWLFSLLDVTRKKKSGPRGLEYFALIVFLEHHLFCLVFAVLEKKLNNVQLLSLLLKHIIISRGSRVSENYHGTHPVSWLGWTSVTLHGNWPSWLLVTLLGSFEHEKLWWLQGCF